MGLDKRKLGKAFEDAASVADLLGDKSGAAELRAEARSKVGAPAALTAEETDLVVEALRFASRRYELDAQRIKSARIREGAHNRALRLRDLAERFVRRPK